VDKPVDKPGENPIPYGPVDKEESYPQVIHTTPPVIHKSYPQAIWLEHRINLGFSTLSTAPTTTTTNFLKLLKSRSR